MKTVEYLLLNLKIIGKIPKHGRIQRSDKKGLIILENNYSPLFLSFKRYYYGDSRDIAIEDLNFIINLSIDCVRKMESSVSIANMITELKNCITGLVNLKVTYAQDITSVSKLDILIQNISDFLIGFVDKVELDLVMNNRVTMEEV
jgi:hypothetical protein